jgi:uncharacterized protein (DUF2336 family)
MTSRLTPRDIEALLNNPAPAVRAEVAAKVATEFGRQMLSDRERGLAEQILRIMVKDAAERVRKALASSLSHSADVPRDVAMALAQDIDDVSVPFLEQTPALSENDLIALVRASSGVKQQAIARRTEVPWGVANALIDTGKREVVRALVRNPGAKLTEAAFGKILDQHADDPEITDPMVRRAELPLTVAERLVAVVSEQLRNHLITHHKVPQHVADRLAAQSRERATVGLLDEGQDSKNIVELVRQLRASGRLTPSLLLRAACTGDMRLCEEAFSQLAQIPVHKAWILLHDAGPLGLRALYDRAKLPEVLYPAFRVALDVYHETELDGLPHDRERFERRMLERILTQYDHLAADDLGYLLDRLRGIAEEEHDDDVDEDTARLEPDSDVAYI